MDTPPHARTLDLDLPEDALLGVEYDLPSAEGDLEEHAAAERDRYDEQILAALVDPTF